MFDMYILAYMTGTKEINLECLTFDLKILHLNLIMLILGFRHCFFYFIIVSQTFGKSERCRFGKIDPLILAVFICFIIMKQTSDMHLWHFQMPTTIIKILLQKVKGYKACEDIKLNKHSRLVKI